MSALCLKVSAYKGLCMRGSLGEKQTNIALVEFWHAAKKDDKSVFWSFVSSHNTT